MSYEEDMDSHLYIHICKYTYSNLHKVRLMSKNKSFLNYINSSYKSFPYHSDTLLRIKEEVEGLPYVDSDILVFRYSDVGYDKNTECIYSILDLCNILGLKFKMCKDDTVSGVNSDFNFYEATEEDIRKTIMNIDTYHS